jgi:hypothetical protein
MTETPYTENDTEIKAKFYLFHLWQVSFIVCCSVGSTTKGMRTTLDLKVMMLTSKLGNRTKCKKRLLRCCKLSIPYK